MRRVIIVCNSQSLGGGEVFTVELAAALRNHGIDAAVAGPASSPLALQLSRVGVPLIPLDLGPKLGKKSVPRLIRQLPTASKSLANLLNDEHPDLWVLQYKLEEMLWPTAIAPNFVTMEHGPVPFPLLRVPFTRQRFASLYESARANLVISKAAKKDVESTGASTVAFRGGVNADVAALAKERRPKTRSELGIESRTVATFAGRVVENKGVDHFVRLIADNRDLFGLIVGQGQALEPSLKLAESLGCRHRISALGHVANAVDIIAASDLFVLPTRNPTEGRPLSVLESLSVGTPFLGTKHPVLSSMRDEGLPMWLSSEWTPFPRSVLDQAIKAERIDVPMRTWADAAAEMADLV